MFINKFLNMRLPIWGINIDLLSIDQIIEAIETNLNTRRLPMQVTGINPEIIINSITDRSLNNAINESSIVNIDGISVVVALRMLGYGGVKRVACPDIFDILLDKANKKGYRVFFLGARKEIVTAMIANLKNEYPDLQIAGFHDGYFSKENEPKIAKKIRSSKADMVFLGMSSPKKELFIRNYLEILNVPLCLGVGGVFDIKAGLYKRAPKWMQEMGLEWLYRLIQEPRRMIKRQVNILKFINLFFKTYHMNRKVIPYAYDGLLISKRAS